MSCLLSLPSELLLQVAENLDCQGDVYSLFLTSRRLTNAISSRLYTFAVQPRAPLPALQWAASKGHIGLAKLLLANGHDANHSPESSSSFCGPLKPLCHAIKFGSVPMVQLLLEHGATVDDRNSINDTAVHTVIQAWTSTAQKVKGLYTPVAERSMYIPRMEQLLEILRHLLVARPDFTVCNGFGQTPLHAAVPFWVDDTSLLEVMLESGGPVDVRNKDGSTVLGFAICSHSEANVKLLLQHGADVNAKDREGMTPLLVAVKHGMEGMQSILMAAGADMDARDINGVGVEEYRARFERARKGARELHERRREE